MLKLLAIFGFQPNELLLATIPNICGFASFTTLPFNLVIPKAFIVAFCLFDLSIVDFTCVIFIFAIIDNFKGLTFKTF